MPVACYAPSARATGCGCAAQSSRPDGICARCWRRRSFGGGAGVRVAEACDEEWRRGDFAWLSGEASIREGGWRLLRRRRRSAPSGRQFMPGSGILFLPLAIDHGRKPRVTCMSARPPARVVVAGAWLALGRCWPRPPRRAADSASAAAILGLRPRHGRFTHLYQARRRRRRRWRFGVQEACSRVAFKK